MKDNLENKFKELENQFDLEEPTIGHFDRFEAKLNNPKTLTKTKSKTLKFIAYFAAAASIFYLLEFGLDQNFLQKECNWQVYQPRCKKRKVILFL